MYDYIEKAALALGYKMIFFLPTDAPVNYDASAYEQGVHANIVSNVKSKWNDASCVIFLVYPYLPFSRAERIPAYYIASNQAYHAAKALAALICEQGYIAVTDSVPIRAIALHNSIGVRGRNALLRLSPFGSRMVLSSIVTNAVIPRTFTAPYTPMCPPNCTACIDACPSKAISRDEFHVKKCMRYYMDSAEHDDFIIDHIESYVGCEICQHVCPMNGTLDIAKPTAKQQAVFDIDALLCGSTKQARALLGKNFTSNGKLTAEAAIFAARNGISPERIKELLNCDFAAVRNTAQRLLLKI